MAVLNTYFRKRNNEQLIRVMKDVYRWTMSYVEDAT